MRVAVTGGAEPRLAFLVAERGKARRGMVVSPRQAVCKPLTTVQIDAVALAREAEDDLRVDHAFALHPLADGPGRAPTRA